MKKKVSTYSKKQNSILDDFTVEDLAKNTYVLFDEYVRAGFTQDQSFELTKIVTGAFCSDNVKK